jgi:hypothetical protein
VSSRQDVMSSRQDVMSSGQVVISFGQGIISHAKNIRMCCNDAVETLYRLCPRVLP